jgi:hypothetical protein
MFNLLIILFHSLTGRVKILKRKILILSSFFFFVIFIEIILKMNYIISILKPKTEYLENYDSKWNMYYF